MEPNQGYCGALARPSATRYGQPTDHIERLVVGNSGRAIPLESSAISKVPVAPEKSRDAVQTRRYYSPPLSVSDGPAVVPRQMLAAALGEALLVSSGLAPSERGITAPSDTLKYELRRLFCVQLRGVQLDAGSAPGCCQRAHCTIGNSALLCKENLPRPAGRLRTATIRGMTDVVWPELFSVALV